MKPIELQELLKLITRAVIKEYDSMTDTQEHEEVDVSDPNAPPEDSMNPAQKAQAERERSVAKQKELKAAIDAQKSAKRESEMYKQKSGEYDRFKKKEMQGKIDTLKKEI